MLRRPVSANAGTLSGPLGTGQCGAKPVGRLVKHPAARMPHQAEAAARAGALGLRNGPSPGNQPRKVTRTDPHMADRAVRARPERHAGGALPDAHVFMSRSGALTRAAQRTEAHGRIARSGSDAGVPETLRAHCSSCTTARRIHDGSITPGLGGRSGGSRSFCAHTSRSRGRPPALLGATDPQPQPRGAARREAAAGDHRVGDGMRFSQEVEVPARRSRQPIVRRHDEQIRPVLEDLDQYRPGPPRPPAGRGEHDCPAVPQSRDSAASASVQPNAESDGPGVQLMLDAVFNSSVSIGTYLSRQYTSRYAGTGRTPCHHEPSPTAQSRRVIRARPLVGRRPRLPRHEHTDG